MARCTEVRSPGDRGHGVDSSPHGALWRVAGGGCQPRAPNPRFPLPRQRRQLPAARGAHSLAPFPEVAAGDTGCRGKGGLPGTPLGWRSCQPAALWPSFAAWGRSVTRVTWRMDLAEQRESCTPTAPPSLPSPGFTWGDPPARCHQRGEGWYRFPDCRIFGFFLFCASNCFYTFLS